MVDESVDPCEIRVEKEEEEEEREQLSKLDS